MERTAERTVKKQSEMDAFHGRKEETPDASNAEVSSVSEDGAGGGTRTHTVSPPTDFESVTSTNSITPALTLFIISDEWPKFKRNLCFRRKIPDSAGRMAVPSCKERKIGVLCL